MAMLELWFAELAGGSADGYLCAKWAFGDGFENAFGVDYVSRWNERHSDLFVMSESDEVGSSVRKIVNHWREMQGKRKANKAKVAKAMPDTMETSLASTKLPKGLPVNCTERVCEEMGLDKLELKQSVSVAEKAGKLSLINSERLDKVARLVKEGDTNLVQAIKMIVSLRKLSQNAFAQAMKVSTLNHKLTKQVKTMATDIEKIKARMQVAHKKVEAVKPKVQSKIAKAHGKANAKLPKSFGKVR